MGHCLSDACALCVSRVLVHHIFRVQRSLRATHVVLYSSYCVYQRRVVYLDRDLYGQ